VRSACAGARMHHAVVTRCLSECCSARGVGADSAARSGCGPSSAWPRLHAAACSHSVVPCTIGNNQR
jgi:hypothetical protein